MQFPALSAHLGRLLTALEPLLLNASGAWWNEPYAPGKWTRRQLTGHLIDSASNNHQRFVRALLLPAPDDVFTGPGYDQEGCVRVEHFETAAPLTLAALLLSYNRFLAHLFAHFPEDRRRRTLCRIGNDEPVTLEQLALDYVAHLEHHLRQLTGPDSALPYSGLPWPPPPPSNRSAAELMQ